MKQFFKLFLFCSVLALFLVNTNLYSHVKWFSDYSFSDKPESFSYFFNGLSLFLIILSAFVLSIFVILDTKMENQSWFQKINNFFKDRQKYASHVLRISMGAVLLVSWDNNAVFMPKLSLSPDESWVGWWQFATIFMLISTNTLLIGALSIFALFFFAVYKFGLFYMLDYANIIGIGYYILASGSSSEKIQKFKAPVLFATLGFSLYWLGFEKIYYPGWSNYILELHPVLTLGLDPAFFLPSAAFIEIALGYLILQGIFERPLAVIITLVFILTTLVFGKVEVIGHTLLHATLVVFLLEGKGEYMKPPFKFYKSITSKIIFVILGYLIITVTLSYLYYLSSSYMYQFLAQ